MTAVQDKDFRPVHSQDDVADLYQGNPNFNNMGRMQGVEEEAFYLTSTSFAQIDDNTNKALFDAVDFDMSVEPCAAQAEHVSAPHSFAEIAKIMSQMQEQREKLYAACEKLGIVRSPFSTIPHVSGQEAYDNMIKPSEKDRKRGVRQRLLMQAFGETNTKSPYYPILNTALHYTTSVRDMQDDLEKGRRAQFLMPFLLTVMENRSPFGLIDGTKGLTDTFNQSMHSRLRLEHRGGVDKNYFLANDGEELAALKYREVLETEMFSYYAPVIGAEELEAEFTPLFASTQKLPRFEQLMNGPLGFRTQFYMARSQQWKWLKTKNLVDKDTGNANELLQERRDFDPGIHQINTMTLVLAAIDNSDDVAREVDALLSRYGLDASQHADNGLALLQDSVNSAYHRGDAAFHGTTEYMDIRYGNGNMREFGREFIKIIDTFYRKVDAQNHNTTDFSAMLEPLRYIVKTGRTDAQVARDMIKRPEDNMAYMAAHDPAWFLEPTKCVGMLAEDGEFTMSSNRKRGSYTPANDSTAASSGPDMP